MKSSQDGFFKEKNASFSPNATPSVTSEVEKTPVESSLTNEPLLLRDLTTLRNMTSAMSEEAFLGRAVLNAVIVKDVTVPNGQAFPPGAEFVKTWRVVNNGLKEWPKSTELVFTGGDAMTSDTRPISIGNVEAGAEVELTTPGLKVGFSV